MWKKKKESYMSGRAFHLASYGGWVRCKNIYVNCINTWYDSHTNTCEQLEGPREYDDDEGKGTCERK
jgi:hypothetical protein